MARKVLLETGYTFTPSTKTIVFNKAILRERLVLITNVTTNQVIYNFSDPNLRATSYTINASNYQQGSTVNSQTGEITGAADTTTVVLNYNTASMSSTDKLQIVIDEYEETFKPAETFQDPVSKFRVSEPQALIDTDFEYSTQPLKWESLSLVQNYPSIYTKGTSAVNLGLTALSGNNATPRSSIGATTGTAHGLVINDFVTITDSTSALANGTFIVDTVPTTTTFTYTAKGQVNGSVLDASYTNAVAAGIYTGARIGVTTMTYVGAAISVTTSAAHGLFQGTPIIVRGTTASTNPPNGNWIITKVDAPTKFEYIAAAAPTGTLATNSGFSTVFLSTRPEGYQQHRATDGGVLITTGGNYTGSQQIRQTRRYFRYQSGKGIQFSTGVKFTPTFDISSISASGATGIVTTLQAHNLQAGATIKVEGVVSSSGDTDSALYNRSSVGVATITGEKSFTYALTSTPTDTNPGGTNLFATVTSWKGAAVRAGLYDDQNGFYFEYDGQTLYACRRESVKELMGTVAVTIDNATITGSSTRFRSQLLVGDKIVIKGRSYEVAQILSDTSLIINPSYRGPTLTGVRYLKTQTYRVPQSQWNMDKMDGTGPSGYNLDISKMQMAYIDYTWYGAGFVRFGFRAVNGNIVYCHKMPNNNVNTAAYMRSGNLPGRFECINFGPYSRVVAGAGVTRGQDLNPNDTTLYIENAVGWPSSGYVAINDGTNEELVGYTGVSTYNSSARGYALTGLTRRASYSIAGIGTTGAFSSTAYTFTGVGTGVTFRPDTTVGGLGTAQVSLQYIYNDCAPVVSHWGVSAIMDGKYDDDKSVLFTAGMNRYMSVGAGVTARPLIAIRCAPSVDSGIGKSFGIREIINRMQLTLESMGVYSQGQFLVQGVLNPQSIVGGGVTFPLTWESVSVGSGSLAQIIYFDNTATYNATAATASGITTGGDQIFAFYTENAGGTNYSATTKDLGKIRDLGSSILSGNGDAGNVNPGYPTGPDVLVITARNLEASGNKNIACRISWTEAQA